MLAAVPRKLAMAQQQTSNQPDEEILQGLGDVLNEDCRDRSCLECERMVCICARNTDSEITITSEDSIRNSQQWYRGQSREEGEFEGETRGWGDSNSQQELEQQLVGDISWEDWEKAQRECGGRGSHSGGTSESNALLNDGLQSPLGVPYPRQTFVRPIMLQPPNMFDSDLRVFFIRSLGDVRVFAGSETLIKTDIEFHPFLTEQGVKTIQSWSAAVSPLAPASPYFSEIFTYCMVKAGSVELCLQGQKQLSVAIINGSSSRDAIIHAGNVIAVLEISAHRY